MKRVLIPSASVLAAFLVAVPAQAQIGTLSGANRPSYVEQRQPYNQSLRVAYDNGYREGLRQGNNDGRGRRAFNYQDERTYQRADRGYNRSYGSLDRYQQSFRTGYSAGYSEAYRRVSPNAGGYDNRYPGGGVYSPNSRDGYGYPDQRYPGRAYPRGGGYGYTPAFENGARDGYEKGIEDVRDRDRYDPLRHKWYRSGDRHYKREYGPKDAYENRYRDGFKEGYDRAFRTSGYRR